jgi:hypothetical protein
MTLCGSFMLYILSQPAIGLGPFTRWQRDKYTDLWLDLRYIAFGAIILGAFIALGGLFWFRRNNLKR